MYGVVLCWLELPSLFEILSQVALTRGIRSFEVSWRVVIKCNINKKRVLGCGGLFPSIDTSSFKAAFQVKLCTTAVIQKCERICNDF